MDTGQLLLVCCFIPFIILLIVGAFAVFNFVRFLQTFIQFTAPNTKTLHRQYEALKTASPNATQPQLVRTIINRYALRQGIVGALTSVGGFVALPIGLSVDLLYSARSNAALSFFIAQVYGIENASDTLNLGQLFVLKQQKVPVNQLMMWQEQFAGAAYQQFAQWILRKTLAKIIPFAGAVVGFLVNYSSAQFFGTLADQYYRRNFKAK